MAFSVTQLDSYADKFKGLSTFIFSQKTSISEAIADACVILPTLRDSFKFEQGKSAFENVFIHGQNSPWITSLGTPGDTAIAMDIAAVDSSLLEFGFTVGTTESVSLPAQLLGGASTDDPVPFSLNPVSGEIKVIKGTLIVVSEDKNFVFATTKFRGVASIVLSGNDAALIRIEGTTIGTGDGKDLHVGSRTTRI